ncbi:hypothetical protein Bca101_041285 [Brassica carinata]
MPIVVGTFPGNRKLSDLHEQEIELRLKQLNKPAIKSIHDQETGLWLLKFETYLIGYWPSFIVPKLAVSARKIAWGGEIVYYTRGQGTHTLTQMGSGNFAEKGFRKAAYFNSIEYIDTSNYPITPSPQHLQATVTRPECYNLRVGSSQRWGTYFFYGGPGRNPQCP